MKRSIYGLKQSPRCWATKLNEVLNKLGWTHLKTERCIFKRREADGAFSYMLVYVDDFLLAAESTETMDIIKGELKSEFKLTDMGPIGTFLGMDFKDDGRTLRASQERYIDELAEKFDVTTANTITYLPPVDTIDFSADPIDVTAPVREIIGGLLYIATRTRPDIAAVTSYLSRYLDKPSARVFRYAKQVLNYLRHTKNRALVLGKIDDSNLVAFADANFAPIGDRKSQSGGVFQFSGSTISWYSKKQPTVSTSTTEAEYVALARAVKETLFLQQLLNELDVQVDLPTTIYEDNQPAIAIATNNKNPDLTKHLDIKLHSIQDYQALGRVAVTHIRSKEQLADGLTKVLRSQTSIDRLLGPP